MPEITDRNFGAELYEKVKNCDKGLWKRLGASDFYHNAEEVIFKYDEDARYHLIISQEGIIAYFIQNHPYKFEESTEIVMDITPEFRYKNSDFIFNSSNGFSSNKLDSTCEIVILINEYGNKKSWTLEMERNKEEKESAEKICNTEIENNKEEKKHAEKIRNTETENNKEEKECAQEICHTSLKRIRKFYNENLEQSP